MTQLSTPRRIVRAVHLGIAGVFFVLIPVMIAGDEELRVAFFQGNWVQLRYLVYMSVLGLLFLAIALLTPRGGIGMLFTFGLVDVPMIKFFWDSEKGALLGPVLIISVLCILTEVSRQISARKRLAT